MASSLITSWQIDGEMMETVAGFIFIGLQNHWMETAAMKLKDAPWKKSHNKSKEYIKKHRHHFANEISYSQSYNFCSSHVQMWELDHKEGRVPKHLWLWTVVLEKTPVSPLDSKEIKTVNLKENQPWIFIGRTDVEAKAPVSWSPDMNSQLTGKDSDAGKDWGQEEKGASEYEIVGWHHWLNGHEFKQTPGDSERQGSLACCSP